MTTFAELWSGLQHPGKELPLLLIDCAGIEGGAAQIPRYIFSEVQCLFVGLLASDLADVAPYLGQLKSLGADVARTVENLMTRQAGLLVVPQDKLGDGFTPGFSKIYRHFRKCNLVQGPDGEKLFFRYYDPRVLIKVVQVLDSEQMAELFGPVDSFVVFDSDKKLTRIQNPG